MWCNTPVVTADQSQRALTVSALVGEANRRNDTTMKRTLLSLRLFAGALLIVMGLLAVSPSAHAAPMATAARSVSVTFRNQTNYTLHNRTYQVMSGIWTLHPPEYISPGQEVYWRTESNGFMTGTSGMVFYDIYWGGNYDKYFTIAWYDPYVGSNTYKIGGTALGAFGGFHIVRSGGSGNNAQVTFTLLPN